MMEATLAQTTRQKRDTLLRKISYTCVSFLTSCMFQKHFIWVTSLIESSLKNSHTYV